MSIDALNVVKKENIRISKLNMEGGASDAEQQAASQKFSKHREPCP